MKKLTWLLAALLLNSTVYSASKPNIIIIMSDDSGYTDLGCYGGEISTPNIDKLAQEGIMFTQHYSGSTVCAPSRSSLMTGLHTGHTPIRGNKEWKPEGQWPMPAATMSPCCSARVRVRLGRPRTLPWEQARGGSPSGI